jgi:glycosyltransferase involved in cell wall biosynthesis
MIVKNEERFLEQCLRSVCDVVDEINIVDTGSTDRTVEIARSFGARIEHAEWRNDFGWARNESLKMATKRWIFQLDADEELLAESKSALLEVKTLPAHLTGLFVRCINESDQYKGGGQMSHAVNRIFPNHDRIRYRGAIHEFAAYDGSSTGIPAIMSPIRIVHHGYMSDVVAERDKFARNMAILEATVEREPQEPFHWYNYGITAYLGLDNERALKGLLRMRELINGVPRAFTSNGLQVLADVYIERLNDPETGLKYAMEALKFTPDYPNAHFSAAKALVFLKRYDEARAMYQAAIDDAKHMQKHFVVDDEVPAWKAQCEIGLTYALEGDDERALSCFDAALKNRPTVAPLRLNRAKALERLGRLTQAEAAYRSLFEDFGDENSTVNYVNFLLRFGKQAEAIDVIDRTYKNVSAPVAVSFLLAAAAVHQQHAWSSGEQYLRQAAEIAPGSAQIVAPLEAIYAARGDDEAISQLRAAEAQVEPAEPADYLRRSHLRLSAKDYQGAIGVALAGLEKTPHDGPLRYNTALAFAQAGMKAEALVHLEAIDGTNATAYAQGKYLQATILRELDRQEEAFAAFETAVTATGDTAARQRLAVELAGLYLRAHRVADAKRVAEVALA